MSEDNFEDIEDLAITGFIDREPEKKTVIVNSVNSETMQSGYCNRCHKRYNSAPVINGKVICPHCDI